MPLDSYNLNAVAEGRRQSPHYHTTACLMHSVDAFCDGLPEPGCICGGDARVEALNEAAEARDAALDAAEFNDEREQARLQDRADLEYEYSKPEYHDEG